ncbi:FAD-binding and (Fe-S)-binding domain-containing protein [Rhodococcus rhodochrous]|uniref:D-lactate dehydrogenase (cytochrome) n=1 Tax=Rhodococcus rhodochrous KG-21 TaxID=1441923 RepID=A0A0M9WQA9_RHORH|nr:FAD-binding and (Fe-S)-binding domain-containing protein [Rhodococcus rhodochrous]KOS57587.1 oxidoreductase [Rhodococcus rhodochrous KG-21]
MGNPTALATTLTAAVPPEAVRTQAIDRLALAHDASHFARTPQAVVTAGCADDVARLFAASATAGVPLTFRSAGTSLSGQAVTDGILVDVRRHFRDIEILDDGARVRVGPGATVRAVNARLARHGRMLGPDPASEVACTLGGVVANNSSGMTCGTAANSYTLLDSLELVLPSGTKLDTGHPGADDQLYALEPELWSGLARIRDRLRADTGLRASIERQFSLKNTMGYGLNSFLDHDRPVDILAHLLVGSEGTLAFITSITMRTVPVLAHTRTGLLIFENLAEANRALPDLVDSQPATIELLDATSLRVGQATADADPRLRALTVDRHAALLVEYRGHTAAEVDDLAGAASGVLSRLPLDGPQELSADPVAKAALWKLRKGLYAKVAEARPPGTAALLEDIAVPVPNLLATCEGLIELFGRHGYDQAVIFGHAKDGNVHFMLTEDLGTDGGDSRGRDRFSRFTDDMVDLVLHHGGTLKAEHGTGRMMTPFVRRQYGNDLYEVMLEVKRLCDPRGLLSPGVVLDDDPLAHLSDLKSAPPVEAEVDRCVECGFCEPVCPSRDLTLTPRQRIVLRRELEKARTAGDHALVAELEADYAYDGIDTCAVDGMCGTACPVTINTGDLIRRLRAERPNRAAAKGWTFAAKHWAATTRLAGTALSVAKVVPGAGPTSTALRKVFGSEQVPQWTPDLPAGGSHRVPDELKSATSEMADLVLFSSCTEVMFNSPVPSSSLSEESCPGAAAAFARLCQRAGIRAVAPENLPSLCCGTPWKSKGFTDGAEAMARQVLPALWTATRGGTIPVVTDASSCTEGLRVMIASGPDHYRGIEVLDAVSYTVDHLLPKLTVPTPLQRIVVHPTCSATQLDLIEPLHRLAAAVAAEVVVPDSWGCCGFAGDRGMLHPELTASATAQQAREIAGVEADAHVSCNRTCELAMSRATGEDYIHILSVLERVSRLEVSHVGRT